MQQTIQKPTAAHPPTEVEAAILSLLQRHPRQSRASLYVRLRCPHWSASRQSEALMAQQTALNRLIEQGDIREVQSGPTRLLSLTNPDYTTTTISRKSTGVGDRQSVAPSRSKTPPTPKAKPIAKSLEQVPVPALGPDSEFWLYQPQLAALEKLAVEFGMPSTGFLLRAIVKNWLNSKAGLAPAHHAIPNFDVFDRDTRFDLSESDQQELHLHAQRISVPNLGDLLGRIVKTWLMIQSSQRRS
jgi:hypothetical protein